MSGEIARYTISIYDITLIELNKTAVPPPGGYGWLERSDVSGNLDDHRPTDNPVEIADNVCRDEDFPITAAHSVEFMTTVTQVERHRNRIIEAEKEKGDDVAPSHCPCDNLFDASNRLAVSELLQALNHQPVHLRPVIRLNESEVIDEGERRHRHPAPEASQPHECGWIHDIVERPCEELLQRETRAEGEPLMKAVLQALSPFG